MAAPPPSDPATMLKQLNQARDYVLAQPAYWVQVVQGTLPIIAGNTIEAKRWGADFLAETFSTPVVETSAKQDLALVCLDSLLLLVEEADAGILKSVVQCCASVYPLIYKHVCSTRDADAWQKMSALKSKILGFWDTTPVGVRLSCIKFAQRVVLAQSKGTTDPRLIDRNDISLALVPSSHPLLSVPSLDAEAQGLLDRILGIFQEEKSDPVLVTATLNNLGTIMKTRPPLMSTVLNSLFNYNPFAGVNKGITTKSRLMMQSVEKTMQLLLINYLRFNQNSPYAGRISQHLQRMHQLKKDFFEELKRKRAGPVSDDREEAFKKAKTEQPIAPKPTVTPVPTPPPQAATPAPTQQVITAPMSLRDIYTLSTDPAMTSFDGTQLPMDLVVQIIVATMYSVNQEKLSTAVAAVSSRFEAVQKAAATLAPAPSSPKSENREVITEDEVQLQLGEYKLPPPPRIPPEDLRIASVDAIDRIFGNIEHFEKTSLISRKTKLGVNRLAASSWDREGWTSMIIRLPTRGVCPDQTIKSDTGDQDLPLADVIRERLHKYISENFRERWDIAVAWLNEEWYNDMVQAQSGDRREPQYEKWTMRVMDSIFPFLESKDRIFMRMISEIPTIPEALFEKVKMLCLDPDRTQLGILSLFYLASFKPPVRERCMDVLEELYRNHPEVKKSTEKPLSKYRPSVLVQQVEQVPPQVPANGEAQAEAGVAA